MSAKSSREDLLYPLAVHLVHGLKRLGVGGHEDKATAVSATSLNLISPTTTNAIELGEKDRVLNHAEWSEESLELGSGVSAGSAWTAH